MHHPGPERNLAPPPAVDAELRHLIRSGFSQLSPGAFRKAFLVWVLSDGTCWLAEPNASWHYYRVTPETIHAPSPPTFQTKPLGRAQTLLCTSVVQPSSCRDESASHLVLRREERSRASLPPSFLSTGQGCHGGDRALPGTSQFPLSLFCLRGEAGKGELGGGALLLGQLPSTSSGPRPPPSLPFHARLCT